MCTKSAFLRVFFPFYSPHFSLGRARERACDALKWLPWISFRPRYCSKMVRAGAELTNWFEIHCRRYSFKMPSKGAENNPTKIVGKTNVVRPVD